MSNNANRMLIVLVAAAAIVLMAVLIFLTWTADTDVIEEIQDFGQYLGEHNDNAGKLIVTLAALIVVVLSLLVIILELAPEDEEKELRVKHAGATTIVPAAALRGRIEEALLSLPEVTAAKARVNTRNNGIATALDLTLIPGTNIAAVTERSARVVTDTIQTDLGLPVAGVPSVRVSYGGTKAQPVTSSVSRAPFAQADTPMGDTPPVEILNLDTGSSPSLDATAGPSESMAPEASGRPVAEDEEAPTSRAEPETTGASWGHDQPGDSQPERETPPQPDQASEAESPAQADGEVSRDPWRQP